MLEALLPDFHEWLPVVLVTGVQGGKVSFFPGGIGGDKVHGRQFQATQEFAEEEPGGTTIEVVEGMNGIKSPRVVSMKRVEPPGGVVSPAMTGQPPPSRRPWTERLAGEFSASESPAVTRA